MPIIDFTSGVLHTSQQVKAQKRMRGKYIIEIDFSGLEPAVYFETNTGTKIDTGVNNEDM